jgi:hypothetical protein
MLRLVFFSLATISGISFGLTGEYLSTTSGLYDKIELMGASAIVSKGASLVTGNCKIQEGYVTISLPNKNSNELTTVTLQIINNGISLLGKSEGISGITFTKYDPYKISKEPLSFNNNKPPKPIPIDSFKIKNNITLSITEGYQKLIPNGAEQSDNGMTSNAIKSAMSVVQTAQLSGVLFKNYIVDFFYDTFAIINTGADSLAVPTNQIVGTIVRLYINDRTVEQKIRMAPSLEARWNLMADYSEPWGEMVLGYNIGSRFVEMFRSEKNENYESWYSILNAWLMINDKYLYQKVTKGIPDAIKDYDKAMLSLSQDPVVNDQLKKMKLFSAIFVVCDESWEPICWIDYSKQVKFGKIIIKMLKEKPEDCYKDFNTLYKWVIKK